MHVIRNCFLQRQRLHPCRSISNSLPLHKGMLQKQSLKLSLIDRKTLNASGRQSVFPSIVSVPVSRDCIMWESKSARMSRPPEAVRRYGHGRNTFCKGRIKFCKKFLELKILCVCSGSGKCKRVCSMYCLTDIYQ